MSEPGAYLLLGPESGEKALFIESVKAKLRSQAGEEPEAYLFYPFETPMGDVVSLLRNGSLFSRRRLVVVRNAHEIKRKEEVELLSGYLRSPAPDATLVLETAELQVDSRLKKAVPAAAQKIFWELFESQKRSWVSSFFSRSGLAISPQAVELLLDMVENDTLALKAECERLALFFGKGKRLESDDVEEFVYHSREESVFSLFDRIAAADFAMSIETLHGILLSGEGNPVQLLAGLLWQFRRLHALLALTSTGMAAEEAFTKLKISTKRSRETYAKGERSYTLRDLERIIVLVADYDARLRAARSDQHRLYLELFLYYCVVKKGRQPEAYRA